MKNSLLFSLLSLVLFIFPFEGKALQSGDKNDQTIIDNKDADRLLLVAFTDRSINSIKGSASPISYKQRGQYGDSTTWSERITNQLAEEYKLEKMREWPMTQVGMHCVVYRLPNKAATTTAIERLSKDKRVEVVQNMHLYKTKAQKEGDPYYKLQTNLHLMQIELAHSRATGRGVTIGMIDTGVDLNHPDLAGQISKDENLAIDVSPGFNTDKHGTAVAGVMVAKHNNGQGIIGIAPDAKLVAYKACWPETGDAIEAECNSFTLALALNMAIKEGVDILNMSLTGPEDPLLTVLINKALEEGIIIVASDSGSDNPRENFPANLKNVISVQSTSDTSSTNAISGSISAPGFKILTTLPHGTYDFISGSSIAAAEISGVIALLLEHKSDLAFSDIHTILSKAIITSKDGNLSGISANVALNTMCATNSCSFDVLSAALPNF